MFNKIRNLNYLLIFLVIIISLIAIVVNFVNKNHNTTIIKENNPTYNKIKKELNKLKKLYEGGLITKKVLEEKQDNLRNTLGNIMRDIGESENEIPQELGRADRAMRQAARELENGRPDQASNAQGRATEMIRRAINIFCIKAKSMSS